MGKKLISSAVPANAWDPDNGNPPVDLHIGWTAGGVLPQIGNELSHTRTIYDIAGRVQMSITQDEDGVEQPTSYAYDKAGKQTAVIDPEGHNRQYLPDGKTLDLTATTLNDTHRTETYYEGTRRKTVTDARDKITEFTYDALGRAVTTKHPQTDYINEAGNAVTDTHLYTHVSYDGLGRKKYETAQVSFTAMPAEETDNFKNHVKQYYYDVAGRLTKVTLPAVDDPEHATTDLVNPEYRYIYDDYGNQVAILDAKSRLTVFKYNELHQQVVKYMPFTPVGSVETYVDVYDELNDLIVVDNEPDSETWAYDEQGRLILHLDYKEQGTGYFYNELGQLWYKNFYAQDSDPNDGVNDNYNASNHDVGWDEQIEYAYDNLGRRDTVVDSNGTATYGYDAEGNLESADSPQGKVGYTYNSITNQQSNTRAYQKGSTTTIYADTSYGYDDLGRLETVTDNVISPHPVNTYYYNAVGSRIQMVLGNSASPYYVYDALNRLTELKNHVSKYEPPAAEPATLSKFVYTLYADGMRKSVAETVDVQGTTEARTVNYDYDNLNRLTQEEAKKDSTNYGYTIDYTYDLAGNRTYRKVTVTNGSGVQELHTKYTYDPDTDQLEKEEFSDQQIAMTVPYGNHPVYAYAQPGGGIGYLRADGTSLSTWSAFWRGLPNQWNRYANRAAWGLFMLVLVSQLLLESLRRLRRAADTYCPRPSYSLSVRTISLVLAFTFILGPSEFQQLAQADELYDNLSRMDWIQWANPNDPIDYTITYGYDGNGSCTSKTTWNGDPDTSGTKREEVAYEYNYQGRLSRLITDLDSASGTNPVDVVDYAYNEAGIRVCAYSFTVTQNYLDTQNEQTYATGKQTTLYLIDAQNPTGYAQVITELNYNKSNPDPATDTPASIRSYTIGDDMLAQTDDPLGTPALKYLLYDGQGSTRQLTDDLIDDSNDIVDSFSYDGYGMMLGGNPTAASPAATNLLYTGEQYDANLQQYYLRARYYNPSNGRFNRMDDYAGNNSDPQSLHKYLYVHANPVNGIDPTGNFESIVGIMAATSIRSILVSIQGTVGEYAQFAAESAYAGLSLNQALIYGLILFVTSLAVGHAIGMVGEFASNLAGRAFNKVKGGFARIGNKVIQPGTILTRNRLIPGTPGIVTGSSSTTLKRNLLKANGLTTTTQVSGYQTMHIIPLEFKNHNIIRKIGMDLDDATNGIFLDEATMHCGSHSNFSRALERVLNIIPENLSIDETMGKVYGVQARATEKFLEGNSLRSALSDTEDQWYRWLIE